LIVPTIIGITVASIIRVTPHVASTIDPIIKSIATARHAVSVLNEAIATTVDSIEVAILEIDVAIGSVEGITATVVNGPVRDAP